MATPAPSALLPIPDPGRNGSDGKADTGKCISAVGSEAVNAVSAGHDVVVPGVSRVGTAPFGSYPTITDAGTFTGADLVMTRSRYLALMDLLLTFA